MLLNLLGFVLLLMTSVVLGILVWNTRINQPSQVTVRIKDNNYDSKKLYKETGNELKIITCFLFNLI